VATLVMFEHLKMRVQTWRRYRRALTELEVHSDRELADLGILRCDLNRLAREMARR
jgi:uncharacterized protein YjiS (DUF1127 family)